MRAPAIAGIILITMGALALVFPSITYTKQDVLDVGPLKATVEEKETIPLPRVPAGVAVVGGVGLLLVPGSSKGSH